MVKKKRKSKHDKPTKGVFIAIDETSDSSAKYDVVVAAVTNDRRAYRDIVEKLNLDFEIGFSSDKERAPYIIGQAAGLIEKIYVAYTPRTSVNPYIKLLTELNDAIPCDPDKPLLVMVDANDEFDSHIVESIFKAGKRKGDSTAVVVVPSNYFCEMQTHDFITGAIGAKINHGRTTWADLLPLGIIEEVPVESKNRKGQTSSTRTPSPLAGLRIHPLRGQYSDAYYHITPEAIKKLPEPKNCKPSSKMKKNAIGNATKNTTKKTRGNRT